MHFRIMKEKTLTCQGLVVLASVLSVCLSERLMYDVSSLVPENCQLGKPIEFNYTPRGEEYVIGNITVYEKNGESKRLLIAVHDIFGLNTNTNMKQVVDKVAEVYDFRVVLSDFFQGHVWDINNFPPKDRRDLQKFIQEYGSWDKTVKYDIATVMNHFKTREGITEMGIFGMCWGGKVALLAASEIDELKAAVLVHPASVNVSAEADGVKIPTYLCPSKNEPDMLPFYEVLKQKFGNNTGHRRFDLGHGFAGARGNFSDPVNVQRVEEVIEILGTFFNNNLKNQ